MRNLLIALAGFVIGGGLVLVAIVIPHTSSATATKATPHTAAMTGMSAMSSGSMAPASLASEKLTIQHTQKGCHVWSDGHTTGATMRLHLKSGQKLDIMDMDVDAHQMMEFAGPMHLQMGGPMMANHGTTLAFTKKGVYRLGTQTVEMKDGGMDVKTVGPDNNLRLVVTVA